MIVEIPVGKSSYKISCEESEREKIMRCAERLNQRVNELSLRLSGNCDEKNLLVIVALMMEGDIENFEDSKLEEVLVSKAPEDAEENINHEEIEEKNELTENDIYDAVSENMENVADYVEKLIRKIRSY